jgi:hypothetical protein
MKALIYFKKDDIMLTLKNRKKQKAKKQKAKSKIFKKAFIFTALNPKNKNNRIYRNIENNRNNKKKKKK